MVCPQSCIELTGESPVEVMAELPRSYPRPAGEIPADKRGDKGGSDRREPMRGTTSDAAGRNEVKPAASLDCTKPKGPEAETHIIGRRQKTAHGTRSGAGLRRGTGSSTQQEFSAEVGRPSPVALQWAGRLYKAKAEGSGAGRESEEDIVPKTVRENRTQGRSSAWVELSRR
jgi:hypothetical protein